MIERTESTPIPPTEPQELSITVDAVSADEGLRVLVIISGKAVVLPPAEARTFAASLTSAADLLL